jgi:hypothetical protein
MKPWWIVLAALVWVGLSGCAGLTARGVGHVKLGMSAAEVQSVAGLPRLIEKDPDVPGCERWYYEDGGVVILQDGKVTLNYPARPPRT